MTLVLAITCKGGIVIASDGQATRVVDKKAIKSKGAKIFPFGDNKLWAGAGEKQEISKFSDFLATIPSEIQNRPLTDLLLKEYLTKFADERKKDAEELRKKKRGQEIQCTEYLVVGYQEYPMIWMLNSQCGHSFSGRDDYVWWKSYMCSIGSGQTVPEALFCKLKDKGREYTLPQGSLIAYRLAVEGVNADPYCGEPLDMWVVTDNSPPVQKTDVELIQLDKLDETWRDLEHHLFKTMLLCVNEP